MNSIEMVEENCRIASSAKADSFTEKDFEVIDKVKQIISESELVGCTGCGKCEQHCPQSIPIREKIKEADRVIRPLPYKIGINIVRKFML